MTNWEEIEVPQGTFIGWGKIGQTVTGKVLSFSTEGGTDFNGNPCPQLVIELAEQADNYKDKGATHETIAAGELVTITAGLANLKRSLNAASLNPGDLVKITFDDTYKTPSGEGKSFKVQVARGAGVTPAEEGDLI